MTIYGEFLFLENALAGAVILVLTAKICSTSLKRKNVLRILCGSIMCGAYAFILLADLHWAVAQSSKLLFSAAVIYVTFGKRTKRAFVKMAAAFYTVSFLMGGTTIALMYVTGIQGISSNGSIYMYGIRYLHILLGILVTALTGFWLADHLKEKARCEAAIMEAGIHIAGLDFRLQALMDTGNFLRDPVSGYPAAVVSEEMGRRILKELDDEADTRCCVIPYRTVGRRGVMYGLKPDYIEVRGAKMDKVVLAFADDDFEPWNGTVKYDILLHQQLFDGRI